MTPIRLLGIPGSLRMQSHNRRLLESMAAVLPSGVELEVDGHLIDLPLYCEDVEKDVPERVRSAWARVSAADGLIFATPEYNQSIPGPLKNALDWLSRAPARAALAAAPVAIVGAALGPGGTRLAQQQLRSVLAMSGAAVMPGPFLFHGAAADTNFDEEQLRALLEQFARWVQAIRNWSRP